MSRLLGRLTNRRAALLALVICALALSIAVPLHTYFAQRDALAAQLATQQNLQARYNQLEQTQQALSDNSEIQAQARERLHYVMPGQTPYVVQLPGDGTNAGAGPATAPNLPSGSWYQQLWNSVLGSGR